MIFHVLLILCIFLLCMYYLYAINKMRSLRACVVSSFYSLSMCIIKRYEVITKIFSAIKGLLTNEQTVHSNLTVVHVGVPIHILNKSVIEQNEALSNLQTLISAYPELQSYDTFIQLQNQVAIVNIYYKTAMEAYNTAVKTYNHYVTTFPRKTLARLSDNTKEPLFQSEAAGTV